MARHSHWHNIQLKKGKTDAKKAQAFSRIAKGITVAVKEGGPDPASNFSLRLAMEKAREVNMPKANIERAVERGTGIGDGGAQLTTAVYEAMGPGGVAMLVETLTDNPNRTVGNVKNILNKHGANPEAKVAWQFERKGVIFVADIASVQDRDALDLLLIDAGAEDISYEGASMTVTCGIKDLGKIGEVIRSQGLAIENSGIEYVSKMLVALSEEDSSKLDALIEGLEEDDDVQAVYTNAE